MKGAVRRVLARLGYDVHRRDLSHPARRAAAIRHRDIDLVLDVGANTGQYVTQLREFGYHGPVVSFEPIPAAFAELHRTHGADPHWRGYQTAVGAQQGTATLNVCASAVLSSMHKPGPELLARLPEAAVTEVIEVPVIALDDVWAELVPDGARVMVKIDVQGGEHAVLDGLSTHLHQVQLLEVEMALLPLYDGGSSVCDLLPRLKGFAPISTDSGVVDAATGQVLDINLLAGRR